MNSTDESIKILILIFFVITVKVENILEHDIEDTTGPFSVDPALLSFPREKEQELTIALVEMSGVKLQKDGSAICTDNAFPAVAALYVSLYVLNLLSNSD